MTRSHLFCFGLGYTALALAHRLAAPEWLVTGTCRSTEKAAALRDAGYSAVLFDRDRAVDATALHGVTHLLVSVAPDATGDPVLALHSPDIAAMSGLVWLGYLSTTGVYGDRGGGWVDETARLEPTGEPPRCGGRWVDQTLARARRAGPYLPARRHLRPWPQRP